MLETQSMTELADAAASGLDLLTTDLPSADQCSFSAHDRCDARASRGSRIMIIDDEMINIEIVKAYLEEEGFRNFVTTTDSTTAVEQLQVDKPDIVLLDINMPHVSGLDLLGLMRAKQDLKMIPAIVLTASNDPEIKLKALRLGASDLLAKPVDPSELTLRVQNVLAVKAYQDHLAQYSEQLKRQVEIRTQELVLSRQEAIHCLARAGEYRDDDTGHHVTRVGRYTRVIADEMGYDANDLDLIEHAAQLHDVGKIGIPDSILHKPGKLDSQEFDLMRSHCTIGRKIINPLSEEESIRLKTHASVGMQIMGSTNSPVLKLAAVIAASHHEKWDGSGYPAGIVGDEIPVEGRIVAVADVFDALSSSRPYKDAFPIEKCLGILKEGRGSHFDPDALDAFMRRFDEILAIHDEYLDTANAK